MRRRKALVEERGGENSMRWRIVRLLQEEPGLDRRGLALRLDVSYGTARYHLDRLVEERIVHEVEVTPVSEMGGGQMSYVVATDFERKDIVAWRQLLARGSHQRVLDLFAARPDASLREAAEALGLSAASVARSRARLRQAGILDFSHGDTSTWLTWQAREAGLVSPQAASG